MFIPFLSLISFKLGLTNTSSIVMATEFVPDDTVLFELYIFMTSFIRA